MASDDILWARYCALGNSYLVQPVHTVNPVMLQVNSFSQFPREAPGPAGATLPSNYEMPETDSFRQLQGDVQGSADVVQPNYGGANPLLMPLQHQVQASSWPNTSPSDVKSWKLDAKYRDGLLSLHTFSYDDLNYRWLSTNALRVYEAIIWNPARVDLQGSPDRFYGWIRQLGRPEFVHVYGTEGMWLIPNTGGLRRPGLSSPIGAIIAVAMKALESRWWICGFGMGQDDGLLVIGQLRPDELEYLNNSIFPQSLARFGQPGRPAIHQPVIQQPVHQPVNHQPAVQQPAIHQPVNHQPAIHQASIHGDTPMLLQGSAGPKPSDPSVQWDGQAWAP